MKLAATQTGPRLSSDDRREHILSVATRMLVDSGLTNISMERLARECGVSKALIYAHFPTFSAVLDGVVRREFEALEADKLVRALMSAGVDRAATESAGIYFRHIASYGLALHTLLINPTVTSQLSCTTRGTRNRILKCMAKAVRKGMGLSARDSVAAAVLLTSIPERAGRMVLEGQIDMQTGAQLCELLTITTLHALAPGKGNSRTP